MGIVLVLVVCAPEERPYTARALNASKRQAHRFDHGFILSTLETDDMMGERFGMLGIELKASSGQLLYRPTIRFQGHSHQSYARQQNNSSGEFWRGKSSLGSKVSKQLRLH